MVQKYNNSRKQSKAFIVHIIGEYYKAMLANSNTKTTRRIVVLTAAITAVTLALATAAVAVVTVNMIPIQYAKAAAPNDHCIGSDRSVACSGSGGSRSCSNTITECNPNQPSQPGGSLSSSKSNGFHQSCSTGKGSASRNIPGTSTSSGKGCPIL